MITSTATGPPFFCTGVWHCSEMSPTAATGGPGGIGRASIDSGDERRFTSTTLPSNRRNGLPKPSGFMICASIPSGSTVSVPLCSGNSATRRMTSFCIATPPRNTCCGVWPRMSSSSTQKSASFGISRDAVLLHVRGVVDRPGDDDLLAGEDAALVGIGDDENRIASGGDELVKDADRIVRPGGEIGQNLNRQRRERLDLSVRRRATSTVRPARRRRESDARRSASTLRRDDCPLIHENSDDTDGDPSIDEILQRELEIFGRGEGVGERERDGEGVVCGLAFACRLVDRSPSPAARGGREESNVEC